MKVYTVYRHPSKGYKAIKRGFSFPAMILNSFWLYMYKLWRPFWIVTGVNMALWLVGFSADDSTPHYFLSGVTWAANIAVFLTCGYFGNAWLAGGLNEQGYDFILEVAAKSPSAAIKKAIQSIADREVGYNRL